MEVITIDSEAFKKLVAKIDRIASFVVKAEQTKGNDSDNDIWMDSNEVAELLRISKRTLQQKCIRLNYRKLIDSKQGVGNDLETTETHYSALIFIDSNSSFTNKDI